MGANCQNCNNVPPEVSIRHHNRYLHSDTEPDNSYVKDSHPTKKEGVVNEDGVRRSNHLHHSALAFSKFYSFEVESLPQRDKIATDQEYEYETIRFQDGSIYDGQTRNNKR